MQTKEAILVGGGRSVKEGIELDLWDKIVGREIWSLNYSFRYMPYLPTREIWVDSVFFEKNVDELEKLWKAGVKICARKNNRYCFINKFFGDAILQYESERSVRAYKSVHALKELTPILYSGNQGMTGTFALSVAIAEGYNLIWLLGYDWGTAKYGDTSTHFYQEGFEGFSTGVGNINIYFDKGHDPKKGEFEVYLRTMQEFNIKIYNVSPDSNIQEFPKLSYPEFFEKLKET